MPGNNTTDCTAKCTQTRLYAILPNYAYLLHMQKETNSKTKKTDDMIVAEKTWINTNILLVSAIIQLWPNSQNSVVKMHELVLKLRNLKDVFLITLIK